MGRYRYIGATLAQVVFAPIIFAGLIWFLQAAQNQYLSVANPNPSLSSLPGVSQCQGRNPGDPCITIFYTPATTVNGVDYTKIMQSFAKSNAERTGYTLQVQDDIKDVKQAPNKIYDIVPVPDEDFIYNYALQNPNTTAWGITFNQPKESPNVNIQYQLWFNATNNANGTDIFGRAVLSMVRGIDEAIISVLDDPTASVTSNIDIKLKDWPVLPPSKLPDSIVSALGPVFFFCSEMIIFINVLNTIVSEKELKLRHGMEVMGLKVVDFACLIFALNGLFTCLLGLVFGFEAFKNTHFAVLFLTFFLFGEAMVAFAFFITTFVRQTRVAILIGIFLFIIGLIFETFVFSGPNLGYLWWNPKTISDIYWKLLTLIPFFSFGRMFLDISILTTGNFDQLTQTVTPGPGFQWNTLYDPIPNSSLIPNGNDGYPLVPRPLDSLIYLIYTMVGYYILTWYFDNIIPNEYGYSRPPWFFLTPSYWGFESSGDVNLKDWQERNAKLTQPDEANEDSDVLEERARMFDPNYFPALKILNLRKVYSSFGRKAENKVACRNSCFGVEQGQLLALLGQNGAGKSTTISMLSGLTPSTSGDALIFNLSVKDSMLRIRKIMGICPQHDILFDDLTAREHIELYAGLKGVPKEQWEPLIQERLQFVRLLNVADVRAGTYSGGMKRRLSLVIATIGDPKIIFLDEPTTGMDPVNRRHVWTFIEKFKKDRVIVLVSDFD
ncbi:ATP-binding cassette sub- A member 1 [Globomyces sp. JEL0801]|nr:ATP-binding cassette sub- A member 1 [Globomyces sp. JEL0801]